MSSSQTSLKRTHRSLAGVNFRRAVNYGKIYLIIGVALSLLFVFGLVPTIHSRTAAAAAASIPTSEITTLLLPVFPVIGSLGGLMIFVSDKDNGVFEYLIAYGVNPSKIFWSILTATFGLVSIILGIGICASIGVSLANGTLSLTSEELFAFYVIPISYATSIFMSMAGMIWSSLTVRRSGINSPVGVILIIGEVPVLMVLFISLTFLPNNFLTFAGAVSLALIMLVIAMIRIASGKMVHERFLSNA